MFPCIGQPICGLEKTYLYLNHGHSAVKHLIYFLTVTREKTKNKKTMDTNNIRTYLVYKEL